jgi:2'-5' RNA ligase
VGKQNLRSAIVVPVAGLPAAVDRWRERTCVFKPSTGVPAHVTVLFPFAAAPSVDSALIAELRAVCARIGAFDFSLPHLRTFPGTLYLAPDPAARFVELTEALVARFPAFKPYRGEFSTLVPHVTVAEGEESVLEQARAELAPLLPLGSRCERAVLLVERASRPGTWSTRADLPLRGP